MGHEGSAVAQEGFMEGSESRAKEVRLDFAGNGDPQ